MHTTNDTPDLDGYVGWVVDDLKWGTLQDDLGTEEEARELSSRTGGLLLQEAVAFTQFPQFSGLGRGHARLLTGFDPSLTHPLVQRADMETEVLRDLSQRDIRITIQSDTNDILAELLGKRLGHTDILPGQPSQLATSDVTTPCSRPLPQIHRLVWRLWVSHDPPETH